MAADGGVADEPVVEIPFLSDLLAVATSDLDASRGLVQRLLSIGDAFLATALTIASLFAGLSFGDQKHWLALIPVPLVLALGYLDGVNWVHFKHASTRVQHLEALFDAYVGAIRERKTARPQAVRNLRHRVDEYHFDMESSFDTPTPPEVWAWNATRLRWWLYPGVAAALVLSAALWSVS